jgi:SAM-dependent MidA family methyltransferase
MLTPLDLPPLAPDEAEHSARVAARMRDELVAAGGWLPFARYMELALYAPGLGYYSAGARKFGRDGDFVTAPEISPAFARCVATQCGDVLAALGGGAIVELGAGTGSLAAGMLPALARDGRLPERYCVLELSADLRERQRASLAALPPELAARVEWLDAPPSAFRGVVVANEVLDALPVERFRRTAGGVEQLGVGLATSSGAVAADAAANAGVPPFRTVARPASRELHDAVVALEDSLGRRLPAGYESELCLGLPDWLAAVTAPLRAGLALFVDYGVARADYYAPDRDGGTLACHYRHRRLDDPYARVGLQDLTAWVDFTHAAEAALAAGLEVAGYTTQAHFLLGTGFDRHVAALVDAAGPGEGALLAHAATRLVLPGEMGERFKCLGLARGHLPALRGFALRDFAAAL